MVIGGWLGKPDVPRIPRQLAAFQGSYNGVTVANLAAGGVDDIGTTPHLAD